MKMNIEKTPNVEKSIEEIKKEDFINKYGLKGLVEIYRRKLGGNFEKFEDETIAKLMDFAEKKKGLSPEEEEILKETIQDKFEKMAA